MTIFIFILPEITVLNVNADAEKRSCRQSYFEVSYCMLAIFCSLSVKVG